ncbi:MAG: diguanylate cyclase [Planctomycetota bacterium]
MEVRSANPLDPLAGLPSLLSLVPAWSLGPGTQDARLQRLLDVDPVLRLRALRAANAPIQREPGQDAATTAAQIFQVLGPTPITSMVRGRTEVVADPGPLFELWLHALATAEAARSLADLDPFESRVDPDLAFGCALVHDLAALGAACHQVLRGQPGHIGVMDWSRSWNLPEAYQVSWLATLSAEIRLDEHLPLARIVIAGEALAMLAGFTHPALAGTLERGDLSFLDDDELVRLTRRLHETVAARLTDVGLDIGLLRTSPAVEDIQLAAQVDRAEPAPALEEGIVRLLAVGEERGLKSLLRILVGNCARYLSCDRAFFLQWLGTGKTCIVRLKHDGTRVKVGTRKITPSAIETALIGKIAGSCAPMVLTRQENFAHNLLDHLGTDSCLVVPVAGGSMLHGFLLLDQAWSLRQGGLYREPDRAMALVGVWGQNLTGLMLRRRDRRSQRDAFTDPLTGLLNRRAALLQLDREILRARRKELPMSVLMLDLDRFKNWNDTYGHLTGDRILGMVGQVLQQEVRGTDIAARIGGEEFLVVQAETSVEEASLVAARIYRAVEEAGRGIGIPVTVSIGLTELRREDSMDSLLARADRALYASKDMGRNRFSIDVD